MKTIKILAFVLLATIMLSGCANRKLADNTSKTPYDPNGRKIETPCGEYSMDDSEYFREVGIIEGINQQSARMAALTSAKSMIKQKINGVVQGIQRDYFRDIAGQAAADKTQRLYEDKSDEYIEYELGHAEKICEETRFIDETHNYKVFIAIQISKKKLIEGLANTLSRDEELNIEFNREQFEKYAAKRMSEMQDLQDRRNGR